MKIYPKCTHCQTIMIVFDFFLMINTVVFFFFFFIFILALSCCIMVLDSGFNFEASKSIYIHCQTNHLIKQINVFL